MSKIITGHNHYYTVGRVKFDSKIDACIFAQRIGKPVEWVFGCHDIFSKYDWTVEPEESLDYYYDKRAREIREKYDYVLITYSGGSDSHNVMASFIRQGLHIDEVRTTHVTAIAEKVLDMSGNSTAPENLDAEYKLNTVAKLQKFKDQLPNTKFTTVDLSSNFVNYQSEYDDESWILDLYDMRNAWNSRYDWFKEPTFRNLLDTGINVGVVSGADKPRTIIRDGNFRLIIGDMAYGTGTPHNYSKKYDYTNLGVEYFYWADTTAPLICKQGHAIKRNVEANPKLRKYWDINIMGEKAFRNVSRRVHEKITIPWIYTTWEEGFQVVKSTGMWDSELDSWWRPLVDQRGFLLHDRGIEYLIKHAKDYITYDANGTPQLLRPFFKEYNLGKFKGTVL